MARNSDVRFAVASDADGAVSMHIGSADLFVVVTMRGARIKSIEKRRNSDKCKPHEDRCGLPGCWNIIENVVPDVKAVICSGIGEKAYVGLLRRDILPIATSVSNVEEAIEKYRSGLLKHESELVHQ